MRHTPLTDLPQHASKLLPLSDSFKSQEYGPSVDIWSVGCIFSELSSHRPLFEGSSPIEMLAKIFQLVGTPHESHGKSLLKLMDFGNFPRWQPKRFLEVQSNRLEALAKGASPGGRACFLAPS